MTALTDERNFEFILTNPKFFTIPKDTPGRWGRQDLVAFIWPDNFPYQNYSVIIESSITSGARYRNIGKLKRVIDLPHVKFDNTGARIGIVPNTHMLPSFENILYRGSTYQIPYSPGYNGQFKLKHVGGAI
jgi:hypothetical protein